MLVPWRASSPSTWPMTQMVRLASLVKAVLPIMLSNFAPIVWPMFGQAIVADRAQAWRIEHALGDMFAFDEKNPAILKVPEDILFAWCHAHPNVAPAFVATKLI